jgi:hypothetical protein
VPKTVSGISRRRHMCLEDDDICWSDVHLIVLLYQACPLELLRFYITRLFWLHLVHTLFVFLSDSYQRNMAPVLSGIVQRITLCLSYLRFHSRASRIDLL